MLLRNGSTPRRHCPADPMKPPVKGWKDGDVSVCGLDPCPFCGGEGMRDITPWNGKVDQQYFIRCRSCAATGGWATSPRGAVRCWNMRDAS